MATETSILESLDVRMARLEGALPFLATKEDISDLRGELRSEIGELRSALQGDIGALGSKIDGEIGSLRSEMQGDIGLTLGSIDGPIAAKSVHCAREIAQDFFKTGGANWKASCPDRKEETGSR